MWPALASADDRWRISATVFDLTNLRVTGTMWWLAQGKGNGMRLTRMAPAKINLCLYVTGKRSDGYHDLATLMQRVSLFDKVTVELTDGGEVSVDCPGVTLPPGGVNIAARAAWAMLERAASARGVHISIEKSIPAAAGLGGGSSNAAAVLLALDELLGCNFPLAVLTPLAARLGADVPFFLLEQAAWATGIGDNLEPAANLPTAWYLLVNPGIAVSTAKVFGNLGLTSPVDVAKLRGFPSNIEGLVRQLHNDLEPVTFRLFPEVSLVRNALLEVGSEGALMSGSGATVFGVFAGRDRALQAETVLAERYGWWTKVVQPLA